MKKKAEQTWILGHVNWYDPTSGRGSIISDDGIWYRIQEFSDIQIKKQSALKEKVRVEFELARDSVHPIIKTVRRSTAAVEPVKKSSKTKEI